MSWVHRAACRDMDPETFFDRWSVQTALEVCDGCPVVQECLRSALLEESASDVYPTDIIGVRGGMTSRERARIRSQGREVSQRHATILALRVRGMVQDEIAEAVGMTQSSVARILRSHLG